MTGSPSVGCCPFVGMMPLLTMTLTVGDLLQNCKVGKLSDASGRFRPGEPQKLGNIWTLRADSGPGRTTLRGSSRLVGSGAGLGGTGIDCRGSVTQWVDERVWRGRT